MALSGKQAEEQVARMKGFIIQEAEEKREELLAKANEECALERQKLVVHEKKRIDEEFKRKEAQAAVQKRIAFSNEANGARLRALRAQDAALQALVAKARSQLAEKVADEATYRPFLRGLVVQALLALREPNVQVRCRKQDRKLVEGVLDDALKVYGEAYVKQRIAEEKKRGNEGAESKKSVYESEPAAKPNVKLAPEAESLPESCGGGVVLTAADGKIVCPNTVESRLAIAAEGCLPQIKATLFPQPLRKTALAVPEEEA